MNHNNKDRYDYKRSYFRHVFHMSLCCALPIVIILLSPIVYMSFNYDNNVTYDVLKKKRRRMLWKGGE